VADGVFSGDDAGGAESLQATDLAATDIVAVQAKIRRRGLRWLNRHGRLDDLTVHALDSPDHAGGWSVDAGVDIEGWNRQAQLTSRPRQISMSPGGADVWHGCLARIAAIPGSRYHTENVRIAVTAATVLP
jgi:hypothetical protein